MISKAGKSDAEALTALTIRSKSYWGYGKAQIDKWLNELTITKNYIQENEVFQLVEDEELVGFYAYAPENESSVKLNYLFVCPNFIGKGYGQLLMEDFLHRIRKTTFRRITLDADPNAETFYLKQGFQVIGKLESSIQNRFLPIMVKEVAIDG
ncbi:MAG: GNAT family N-acetyltransferase [Pricia sp.]